jgi:hypothetical protein
MKTINFQNRAKSHFQRGFYIIGLDGEINNIGWVKTGFCPTCSRDTVFDVGEIGKYTIEICRECGYLTRNDNWKAR